MAAALRQIGRMITSRSICPPRLVLVIVRPASSSTSPDADGAASAAASPDADSSMDEPDDQHCYAIGAFGRIRFPRTSFIPMQEFLSKHPPLEPVPHDRLVDVVDMRNPYLTAEISKLWMRSGFLAPYFLEGLDATVSGAYKDGNVGIVAGINVIGFLQLKIQKKSELSLPMPSERYPVTYEGFSNFMFDQIVEAQGLKVAARLPGGLQGVRAYAADPSVDPRLIIYHPEFMPLHLISRLYQEVFRILRRELPALGEHAVAHATMVEIDTNLGGNVQKLCQNDKVLSTWLGVHAPKGSGLLGLGHSLSSVPAASIKGSLTQSEWNKLKSLLKKCYLSHGLLMRQPPVPVASAVSGAQTALSFVTKPPLTPASSTSGHVLAPLPQSRPSSAQVMPTIHSAILAHGQQVVHSTSPGPGSFSTVQNLPKNPQEAIVIDIHRHASVHLIEEGTIRTLMQLLPNSAASFKARPINWKDGTQLLLHKVDKYPHISCNSFMKNQLWERLGLVDIFEIPKVLCIPCDG
ncbi:hypothetical protein DAI22_06g062800 [Oryza sativa Japonica Group]|jgi:hypothetical protein|nr:hypothetical protein DAI22_06g062800 [Oryza sativa Japonica Group]